MARQRNISGQTKRVLKSLIEAPDQWRHGYQLCKQTGLKSGTLYPILIRLSDQGFLKSEWREADPPGRPPRHVYRLSQAGMSLARSLEVCEQTNSGSLTPAGAVS